MNKTTTVRAEFIVSKEAIFSLSEFTDRLEIKPMRSYNLGDRVGDLDLYRKVSCWCVGTQDEESFDINNQLSQLIEILGAKQQVLIELKKEFEVDYVISVTIDIEQNRKPAIYLEPKTIEFLYNIKAEIDIDVSG